MALSFWFLLVEGYLLPLIFKLILKWNILNFGSKFRSIFRTLSNIQDRGFCTNIEQLFVFDYFCKKLSLRFWQDSEFASKASYDFVEKAPSQMFIFAKLLAIFLLNLIDIAVLCTVKSTWPDVQHIWFITKIIRVFPNHMFL